MDQKTTHVLETMHCPTCNIDVKPAVIENCTVWNETVYACPECGEELKKD